MHREQHRRPWSLLLILVFLWTNSRSSSSSSSLTEIRVISQGLALSLPRTSSEWRRRQIFQPTQPSEWEMRGRDERTDDEEGERISHVCRTRDQIFESKRSYLKLIHFLLEVAVGLLSLADFRDTNKKMMKERSQWLWESRAALAIQVLKYTLLRIEWHPVFLGLIDSTNLSFESSTQKCFDLVFRYVFERRSSSCLDMTYPTWIFYVVDNHDRKLITIRNPHHAFSGNQGESTLLSCVSRDEKCSNSKPRTKVFFRYCQ